MSGKKREIHVKDLVIKADNVIFEQPKRRQFDPFFGPRREEGLEDDNKKDFDVEADFNEESSSSSSSSSEHDDKQRRPFSWI